MERRRVGQSAALVSSVVLVGGFIAFCGGAAVFLGGSKSNSMFSFVGTKPSPPNPPKYMSGSKSTFILVNPTVKPSEPPKPADETPAALPTPDPKPPAKPGE
jgi:hypothetical protein